jgi:hypothetical protein
MTQNYEDFTHEILEVCRDKTNYGIDLQKDIVRILDYYYNLSPVQLLLIIPAILVRTKREDSMEFTLEVVNGWCRLKTPNYTFKIC